MTGQTEANGKVSPKARVLVVDDDQIVLDSLGSFLEAEGYDVTAAATVADAVNCLEGGRYNVVMTDVSMPDRDGFELLKYVQGKHGDVVVVMITGYGTIESAVEAMKQGALDYLTKPIIDDEVRMAMQRALQQQALIAENRRLKSELSGRYGLSSILGTDARLAKVLEVIEAVADSRSTALITGESGTGKTLVARAIHAQSPRKDKPFVEVSCGAMPETLLETELFGHVRGAFTGAAGDKLGKFAAADGGTIFLDEISSASPQLQVKLLRVLQERRFEPVGSNETREVDVRVILATNHDLGEEVQAGRFRKDLYYRINVVNIELPPLRQRLGDIPLLAEHFLRKYREESNRPIEGFTPAAMTAMQNYHWPGNVRELENCVERAVVLCRSRLIDAGDLPPAVLQASEGAAGAIAAINAAMNLKAAMAVPEKQILQAALRAHGGNRQAAAKHLGINRTTLYKKMRKFDLMRE